MAEVTGSSPVAPIGLPGTRPPAGLQRARSARHELGGIAWLGSGVNRQAIWPRPSEGTVRPNPWQTSPGGFGSTWARATCPLERQCGPSRSEGSRRDGPLWAAPAPLPARELEEFVQDAAQLRHDRHSPDGVPLVTGCPGDRTQLFCRACGFRPASLAVHSGGRDPDGSLGTCVLGRTPRPAAGECRP